MKGHGTDRAFRRLASLGEDPDATLPNELDAPAGDTAELPAVPRGRHRARSRLITPRRVAITVTGAALLAGMGAVVASPPDAPSPGVTLVEPPTVTEPEPPPSRARPSRAAPPALSPSRTPAAGRKPKPSPAPARTVTVTPSPERPARSPAAPVRTPDEPPFPLPSGDPEPPATPTLTATASTESP